MSREEDLVSRIAAHAGGSVEDARGAAEVVLSVIGAYLSPAERDLVAQELPTGLATPVVWAAGAVATPLEEQVLTPGMKLGRAHELAASVLRVLAEVLSDEVLIRMQRALPPGMAAMLVVASPDPDRVATREIVQRPRRRTLSEGHPGSDRPVSDSQPLRAHRDSPAAANPHGDSKLSSTPGLTQERLHDTLAEGQPRRR